jgi:lipopolysaccharide/colanic/teichoic acid biosynthesis glycosyltransferase
MTVHESMICPDNHGELLALNPESELAIGARRINACRLKRPLDVVGAGLGLVLLSPVLAIAALIIRMESSGSPIFGQRRTGEGGRTFVIYKFRTMRVLEDGPTIVQAAKDDDRITGFGRFLRRTSLDELPQLINILKGDMSLVGPRPHAVAHDEYYGLAIPGYGERFRARPGLTGLAQVSGYRGRTEELRDMAARVNKDLEYIRTWSLWLDLRILLKTVAIFAFHPAAY